MWWGQRKRRHPHGAEEEISGLRGREETKIKDENIPTVSSVCRYGKCMISGEQDGQVNSLHSPLTRRENIFPEGFVMCFTETWLPNNVPDTLVNITGFYLVRVYRSSSDSRKRRGGGVAIYVINRIRDTFW